MATKISDASIDQLILALKSAFSGVTSDNQGNTKAVKDNTSSLNGVVDVIEVSADQIVKAIVGLDDATTVLERSNLKKIARDQKEEKARQEAAAAAARKAAGVIEETIETQTRARTNLEKFSERFVQQHKYDMQYVKTSQDLLYYAQKIQKQYHDAKPEEIAAIKRNIQLLQSGVKDHERQHWSMNLFNTDIRYASTNIKLWAHNLIQANAPWLLFVKGLKQLNAELSKSTDIGLPMFSDGLMGLQDAFRAGMTPAEVMELKKKNILGASAAGGLDKYMDNLTDASRKMMDDQLVSNQKDGVELQSILLMSVQKTGLKYGQATKKQTDRLTNTFATLHKSIGLTAKEMGEMTEAVANDTEHRNIMLKLSPQQRASYVADTLAVQEHLIMSKKFNKEQAAAITDFIKKIQGETYKDRMKRGLKTRLAMGLLGVSGGEQMQKDIMNRNLDEKGKKRLADKQAEMSKAASSRQAMGGANELFVDVLDEKTNGILSEARTTNDTLQLGMKTNTEENNKIITLMQKINSEVNYFLIGFKAVMQVAAATIVTGLGILLLRTVLGRRAAVLGQSGIGGMIGPQIPAKELAKRKAAERAAERAIMFKDMGSRIATTTKNFFTGIGTWLRTSFAPAFMNIARMAMSMAGPGMALLAAGAAGYMVGSAIYKTFVKDAVIEQAKKDNTSFGDRRKAAKMNEETARLNRETAIYETKTKATLAELELNKLKNGPQDELTKATIAAREFELASIKKDLESKMKMEKARRTEIQNAALNSNLLMVATNAQKTFNASNSNILNMDTETAKRSRELVKMEEKSNIIKNGMAAGVVQREIKLIDQQERLTKTELETAKLNSIVANKATASMKSAAPHQKLKDQHEKKVEEKTIQETSDEKARKAAEDAKKKRHHEQLESLKENHKLFKEILELNKKQTEYQDSIATTNSQLRRDSLSKRGN